MEYEMDITSTRSMHIASENGFSDLKDKEDNDIFPFEPSRLSRWALHSDTERRKQTEVIKIIWTSQESLWTVLMAFHK